MDLFAELIGELSNIRFASVSDRFIAELEKYNNQTIMKERQGHMEMLIKGMRYLKIKVKKKTKRIIRVKYKLFYMCRFTLLMLLKKPPIFYLVVLVSLKMLMAQK